MTDVALLSISEPESNVVTPDDVQKIVQATSVVEVRLDEMHAGPVGRVDGSLKVDVEVGEPQVGRDDERNRVLVRLSHALNIYVEGSEEEATRLEIWHVVTLAVTREIETTWPAVAAWIETNIYFLAYPYVRQTVSTVTTSLGLPALVLDYLSRDERPLWGSREE